MYIEENKYNYISFLSKNEKGFHKLLNRNDKFINMMLDYVNRLMKDFKRLPDYLPLYEISFDEHNFDPLPHIKKIFSNMNSSDIIDNIKKLSIRYYVYSDIYKLDTNNIIMNKEDSIDFKRYNFTNLKLSTNLRTYNRINTIIKNKSSVGKNIMGNKRALKDLSDRLLFTSIYSDFEVIPPLLRDFKEIKDKYYGNISSKSECLSEIESLVSKLNSMKVFELISYLKDFYLIKLKDIVFENHYRFTDQLERIKYIIEI